MEGNNSYRVRTGVGSNSPDVLNVKLNQSFEFLNILSLKIGQKNLYKMPSAPYGVVVGRVLANQTFGIENAKVSIFIPKEDTVFDVKDDILYTYTSSDSVNYDGVRYNLLPSHIDEECHQDVGTMFEKEYVLDNDDVIRVFEKYYTYTTKTNGSGDYFIYGVPVGQHTLHVDVDLSDIGKLSVRPHDMIGQGYNIGMFESPNKFKTDKNLNILPQIKTQDKPIQVFPFWGDTSDDDTNAMITRADIEIDYKFEPTAVFMGSIITDSGNNSISHKCVPNDLVGKMSELTTGAGKIEMIRKTFDGKVEEFSVKGNRLIDGDGVWCYQIPMNLDYVGMDEFGNIVPTEDPNNGIPTRARVRFRISMDEDPMDDSAKKRARFLVPNNPRLTDDYPDFKKSLEADYSFGTFTKEESYRDLFWNNVYTVKSYIPRLQRRATANTKKFTGIKMTNHPGGNNPMPYNNISIKMNFQYRLLCSLTDMFLRFISVLNTVLAYVGIFLFYIGVGLAKFAWATTPIDECGNEDSTDSDAQQEEATNDGDGKGKKAILRTAINSVLAGLSIVIRFSGDLCEEGDIPDREKIFGNKNAIEKWADTYIKFLENWEGCGRNCTGVGKKYLNRIWKSCTFKLRDDDEHPTYGTYSPETYIKWLKDDKKNDTLVDSVDDTMNCVQSMLAQENEVTSFNFHNDWINGVLYAPLWYRKIKPRRRVRNTNLSINKVDDWCSSDPSNGGRKAKRVKIAQTCSQQRILSENNTIINPINRIFDAYGKYRKYRKDTEMDCFGLKCHEKNISLIKVDNGIIVRKETKYGEYVYYYKSVEYSDKKYMENILDGDESPYGDVKLLFATDLVLLGNLNECNSEGIPQFFKHLSETTYQMPPDLVSVAYDENDGTDDLSEKQTISFFMNLFGGDASADSTVETEFSGADYGNVGVGQFGYDPNKGDGYTQSVNTKTNPGYDNGGLFYDLTCTSGFVSPKGCVNLSRICEFGVSLDQSVNLLDSNGSIVFLPPDGFVSYDELYNMDARSMFSTMNCNWLRERVDEKTGYKTYDFNYNYPENFDGTLKLLMSTFGNSEVDYRGNYNLEKNSDAYLKFRYGFDKDKFKVGFYNTTGKVKNPPRDYNDSPEYDYTQQNVRRFPRYENSFYFYFGLKSGSTAINKFREQFYAECTNDAPSESIISLDYKPNSWCRNHEYDTDGYIAFDFSNIQLPCAISFDEVTEGDAYDVEYTGITSYKLYIGSENEELNSQNYDRLYVDLENTQVDPSDSDNYKTPFLYNGVYVIAITDADGNIYKETVSMTNPTLSFGATPVRFTMTNEELENRFSGDYEAIASDIAMSEQIPLLRSIGGYITVSSINNVNTPITDNFSIEIASESEINSYQGSRYIVRNGNVMKDGVNPIGELNGEYSFGVPKGNENYIVTVTEFCSEYAYSGPSENKETMRIYVGEPEPFKMFINGVDTSLLSEFDTGYIDQPKDGVIDKPYNAYNEDCGIGYGEVEGHCAPNSSVKGWDNIGDIGVYKLLTVPSVMVSYASISNTVNLLTESLQPEQYVYNFTDEYYFDKTNIGLSSEDSLEDYFNTDIEAQINVITELNQVIQRRIDLAESMYSAFCIYSDEGKMVSIQTQTSEKPVKTLIYYNPDYTSLAFENINGNIQQLHPAGYYIFDEKKEENEMFDFGEPTITIKKKMVEEPTEDPNEEPRTYPEYYPIFKEFGVSQNISYKLPPYCAVMNGINETIPSNIGTIPFGGSTISEAMAAQVNMGGNGMKDMFGFHMIDKRPFTRMNIWLPINNYPFYWPDIDESQDPGYEPPEGAERGGYITMNGCISGYLYNCFSTSTTQVAAFNEQSVGDGNRVEFYTLTTRGTTNIPDEYAIPTKRVMYSQPKGDDYVYTYNDFESDEADEDYLSFDYGSRPDETNGVDTRERYISFTPNATSLTITGKFNNFSESLGSDLFFGIPENTIVCHNYDITPVLVDSNGGKISCDWRFFNAANPIYQKFYDNSHYLINEIIPDTINPEAQQNLVSMLYGWDDFLPDNHSITDQTINRVFAVGRSIDGRIRAFSPTYEISKVHITSAYCNNDEDYCVDIFFNTNDESDSYYLRYYPYKILIDVYYVDGINEKYESDIIECDYENLPHVQIGNENYKYNRTTFLFLGRNIQNIEEIVVTVKDITGIIRLTEEMIP